MTDFEKVIDTYIQLRDRKAQLKAAYDASVAPIEEAMLKAEDHIRAQFQAMGTKSVKTDKGTAYVQERTSATAADWDMVLGFVRDNEAWHMLERRVNKTAVDEYFAQNKELPPGVNYRRELVVNVRRS